ncbi:hypothetical protein ACFLYQ_04130 [Chloroflexota bacterium]
MAKLVCDRCGKEITDKETVEIILEGVDAWQGSLRRRGSEPRGIYPCENYARCGGELIVIKK